MNDLERELKLRPRSQPSPALNARVHATLQTPSAPFARPVPLWACAAACVLCLATGWIVRPTQGDAPVVTPNTVMDPPVANVRLVCNADTTLHLPTSPFMGRRFAD